MKAELTIGDLVRNDSTRLRKVITDAGLSRLTIAQFVDRVAPAQFWAWRNVGAKIFDRFVSLLREADDSAAAAWVAKATSMRARQQPTLGTVESRIVSLRVQLASLEAQAAELRGDQRSLSADRETAWRAALLRMARGGTLQDVGTQLGVTRERVRQRLGHTLSRVAPEMMHAFQSGSSTLPQFLREHRAQLEGLIGYESGEEGTGWAGAGKPSGR